MTNQQIEETVESHTQQLNQAGIALTDLVVRVTAMERLLISSGAIKNDQFKAECEKITTELTELMRNAIEAEKNSGVRA